MTFDEIYPDAPRWFEPKDSLVIKCSILPRPCAKCGKPTQWVEYNFECPLCSPGCVDAMWAEYRVALRT